MVGGFIQSSILTGSAALIRARGGRPASLARRAGIPVQALSDPDLPIAVHAVVRFYELAAEVCAHRTWGLSLASGMRLATVIGPLWILLRNARTVGQMCEVFAQNFDLFSDAAVAGIERRSDGLLLTWSLRYGQGESEVQTAEFSLAVIAQEIRAFMGGDWRPVAVMFRHARPAGSLAPYRAVFGSDLRFDQAQHALLLDSRTLDTPIPTRDASARALAQRLVTLNERGAGAAAIVQRVEAIVRGLMPYAPCSLRDVGDALGIGPRALQKQLKRQQRSFVRIRDAVRADLADKYLRHSNLHATQIAEILGYGDPTSLSRSFRRWQGRSMRDARRST